MWSRVNLVTGLRPRHPFDFAVGFSTSRPGSVCPGSVCPGSVWAGPISPISFRAGFAWAGFADAGCPYFDCDRAVSGLSDAAGVGCGRKATATGDRASHAVLAAPAPGSGLYSGLLHTALLGLKETFFS